MESVSYKIKIRASINGVEKIPSKIAWIQGNDECLLKPCYKENDYLIVELIPGCIGNACIEGWLIFDNTCANCDPIYFKRCFCSNNEDCADCEECNPQGICQSKCTETEYCLDNTCVECDPNKPCPNGKVCVNGTCVCPQGFFEKDGRCVQCDETTVLNNCQECKNGLIIDKPCDGKCNPVTGECVDCLVSGDCYNRIDGKNCCNVDTKQCECCPGTKWSAEQNKCIPILCTGDESCGDPCLKCTDDGCQPIICPEGFKCWNGECVEWPCIDTSCENGADCGTECGCVEIDGVKQCVPCHILECLGLCEQTLGCKCSNTEICVPVNNCDQYCDDLNPCIDPNCTCYNNRCVSCENFPCSPDDCSTRQNCGCTDGNCEGGNTACKDKLEIIKECGDNKNSCKLTGKLTLSKQCPCSDIRFETSNISACTSSATIKLKVDLFKGDINYNNFNHLTIGDNELVEGLIDIVVSHYSLAGNLISLSTSQIDKKSIVFNSVGIIEILKDTHYKTYYTENQEIKGTKVKIELFAKGIKIPNNDCINYTNNVLIAEYTLDFSNVIQNSTTVSNELLCNIINTNISLKKKYIHDSISIKKPLFLWSKTATDHPNTRYEDNTNYNSKGFFRKIYGIKTATGWEDVLSTVDEGLVANYNYLLSVDCGCDRIKTHNSLDFCCLPDLNLIFTNCNRKVEIPSFRVCEINGKIDNGVTPEFNKSFYRVHIAYDDKTITTKDITFNIDGLTTNKIVHEDLSKPSIASIRIEKYYKGGLLENTPCFKEYVPNSTNLPEVVYNTKCDDVNSKYTITVNQVSGSPIIDYITFKLKSSAGEQSLLQDITMGNNSQKSLDITYNTLGNFSKQLIMVVHFNNGCVKEYLLPTCDRKLLLTADPDIYSGTICGQNGPQIEATTIGFGTTVQYSLNNGTYQSSNIFTNIAPGIYIVKAKEIINGIEYIAEETIEILPKMEVQVVLNPSSICAGTSSILTITGETGQIFTITGPTGNIISNNATLINNTFSLPNLTAAGTYTVISNNTNAKYCTTNQQVILAVGGETLSPQLIYQPGTYCVGQPIPIRIFDNGKNKTYNINTSTGQLSSTTLQASLSFNGTYTPSTTSGAISIVSSTSSCDTMTPTNFPTTVTIVNGPVIGTPTTSCVGSLKTVTVNITAATTVTIGGITVTPVGTTYSLSGITASNVDIIASNGSCTITQNVVLNSCDCPNYSASIVISQTTCGQGQQTITFNGYSPGLLGYNYQLQKNVNGIWTNVSGSSGVFSDVPTPPQFTVNNILNVTDYYKVTFTNNSCTFETNEVETSALLAPVVQISGPTTATIGETITLNALYGDPSTTYQWSGATTTSGATTSLLLSNSGTYNFNLITTTGPCTQNLTHTVTVTGCSPASSPTISSLNSTNSCSNITASVTGGSGAYTYLWTATNGVLNQTSTTFNVSVLEPGQTTVVTLVVTDANGCVSNSVSISYTKCSCMCDNNTCTTTKYANSVITNAEVSTSEDIYVLVAASTTGAPWRLIITEGVNTYVDTLQMVYTPVINRFNEGSYVYQNIFVSSINPGGFYDSVTVLNWTDCTFTTSNPNIHPIVDSGVIAKRPDTGYTGIYIKIPASKHLGNQISLELLAGNADAYCGSIPTTSALPTLAISCQPFTQLGLI